VAPEVGQVYNSAVDDPAPSDVRAWARARGFPVGDRGRLSPSLVALYLTEHRTGSTPARRAASERADDAEGEPRAEVSRAAQRAPRRGTTVRAKPSWNWPSAEGGDRSHGKGEPPRR
jgi:hypothetical protein